MVTTRRPWRTPHGRPPQIALRGRVPATRTLATHENATAEQQPARERGGSGDGRARHRGAHSAGKWRRAGDDFLFRHGRAAVVDAAALGASREVHQPPRAD